jgi:amino acid transporter
VATVAVVLLYIAAGIKYGDFNANAFQSTSEGSSSNQMWFSGGIEAFYFTFPRTFWFLGGIETAGVIAEEVENVTYNSLSVLL